MKFNKLTHFMIIVFLAVTFIVIYLYYTIKDVKKISADVQKLSKDVLSLSQSISSITSSLLTHAPVCYAPSTGSTTLNPPPPITPPNVQITVQQSFQPDDESVVDDLHQIIETIDDETTKEDTEGNVDILTVSEEKEVAEKEDQEQPKIDAKELKNLSYEALKKYCKEHGIDSKGNKDALISKILAS